MFDNVTCWLVGGDTAGSEAELRTQNTEPEPQHSEPSTHNRYDFLLLKK